MLAERWDGTSWTITPTSANGTFFNVSCTQATTCTAAGEPMQRWNGTGWAAQPTAGLPGSHRLDDVSCTSSTACVAVGRRG